MAQGTEHAFAAAGRVALICISQLAPESCETIAGLLRRCPSEWQVSEIDVMHSVDQLQKLEEKLSKVVAVFKKTQAENQSLYEQLERLKADSGEGARQREALEREVQTLRREREEVRQRVQKLLDQVDGLTRQDSAGQ